LRIQHDLDRGDASAQVSITYFFDAGHVDRDRWPGERAFPSLRRQRAAARTGSRCLY
jgi:hypothetical protein